LPHATCIIFGQCQLQQLAATNEEIAHSNLFRNQIDKCAEPTWKQDGRQKIATGPNGQQPTAFIGLWDMGYGIPNEVAAVNTHFVANCFVRPIVQKPG